MPDPAIQAKYLKASHRCPYCGSNALEGEGVEVDGPSASQEIYCRDCGRQWYDLYRLVGFEPFNQEPTP